MKTRDWATVDFYAVLGVPPTATSEEIGLAFRALAKQSHPDRVGSAVDSESFTSITAAYDVLRDDRLRAGYDAVRIDAGVQQQDGNASTIVRPRATPDAQRRPALSPALIRRRGRRWLAAGTAVFLAGLVVGALIVHLQIGERERRAGRIKTDAIVVVTPTRTDVRFTTAAGTTVQVPEPERVNPGTARAGDTIAVLYRPDRPADVLIDESTTARDITLWFVAVKLLVGGVVFLGVGINRLRKL